MVPRRTDGAEDRLELALHDEVDRVDRRPGSAQRRVQGVGPHGGVGVEHDDPFGRGLRKDALDVVVVVDALELQAGRHRGVDLPHDHLQSGGDQPIEDGGQPRRLLRVPLPHVVKPAVGV